MCLEHERCTPEPGFAILVTELFMYCSYNAVNLVLQLCIVIPLSFQAVLSESPVSTQDGEHI